MTSPKTFVSNKISIRAILFTVSLIVLLLPLGSIYFLRIYENELVRQTESELIAQAAFLGAAYKHEVADILKHNGQSAATLGPPLPCRFNNEGPFNPVLPSLDMANDPIYPPRPDGRRVSLSPNPVYVDASVQLMPVIKDAQRVTLSGIKILDPQGIVVASQNEMGLSFSQTEEVQGALAGRPVSLIRERILKGKPPPLNSISRGAAINVFVAMPVFLQGRLIGVVVASRTPRDIMKALYGKQRDIGIAALILVLLTLGLATLTSYTITRPIDALIVQAQRIANGEPGERAPIRNPVTREFELLSQTIARMAETIENRSEYIRNFAMHVSHEFKTPLTSIQGSIELLQEHLETMPAEQRERFLNNIAQDTDRLKRLVSRLLELARADVASVEGKPAEILRVLSALKERFKDFDLSVSIDNQTGEDAPRTRVPAEVLETLLVHLFENSHQHGAKAIAVSVVQAGSTLQMTVCDDGEGISEANRNNIFTPFFTTRRQSGGTGMGLSITQALLHSHQGHITLLDSEQGAKFLITLPSA